MAEYAGYVAAPPVNYGEITDGLVSNIIAIDQAKREEEKKTQQEFDKFFDSNTKELKDFDYSKSQTFNDMIIPLAEGTKDALYNAYKSGNKQAVNRVTANLKSSINAINSASKAINENLGLIEKATAEGGISEIGNIYADMYADATDFSNGSFVVLPDGTVPYVKYNKDGKIESQNSIFNVGTITKATPFVDRKVDYDKELNTWASGLGTFKDEQGRVVTVNPSQNPAFPKAKETKIAELTSTPRNTARFLSAVAGYQGYKDQASKQKLIDDGVPEDKLIQVSLINGVPQPVLTDAQNKVAKELAAQQIDQRIGIQRTVEKASSGGSGGFGTWLAKEEIKDQKKAEADAKKEAKIMAPKVKLVQIVNNLFTTRNKGDFALLKQTASKLKGWKNVSVNNANGTVRLSGIPKGVPSDSPNQLLAEFATPQQLAAFLSGETNQFNAESEFATTMDYMLANDIPIGASKKPAAQKGKYD